MYISNSSRLYMLQVIIEKNLHLEEPKPRINERMDLELNDYAPSGANGRHTPRAP